MNTSVPLKKMVMGARYVKLDAQAHLLWQYRPVWVGPGLEYKMQIVAPYSPFADSHRSRIRRTISRMQNNNYSR